MSDAEDQANDSAAPAFAQLSPDLILEAVEEAADCYLTPLCRPLASYINRVIELETEDGVPLIAKFYRPGRWSREALQEEQDFLLELEAAQLPVIAPLELTGGGTLGEAERIFFSLFPKMGGRTLDELRDELWPQIGRLIARVHAVGELSVAEHRTVLDPEESTLDYLDYLIDGEFLPYDLEDRFIDLVETLVDEITGRFEGMEFIRVHGDCHLSNLILRPNEGIFLIDFDDLSMGPPVQDLWLLLPGRAKECERQIDLFLEGYRSFREFDKSSLQLIEPLRAMRFIHYIAWCARQTEDGVPVRTADEFGSHGYWEREINDLEEQLQRIRSE